MKFDSNKKVKKTAKALGFFFTYVIFSTFAYFVLILTDKFPNDWNYFYIFPFTLCIILLGTFLKQLYKI